MPIKVNEETKTTKKVVKKVAKPKVEEVPQVEAEQVVEETPKKVAKKTTKKVDKVEEAVEQVAETVKEEPKKVVKKTTKKTTKVEKTAEDVPVKKETKVVVDTGKRLERVMEDTSTHVYFPEKLTLDEEYVPVEAPNKELLKRILNDEKGYPVRICLKEGLESPDDTNVPYTMLVGLYACDDHLLTIDITSKLKDKNSTIRLSYEELRDGMQDGLPFRTYIRKSALK